MCLATLDSGAWFRHPNCARHQTHPAKVIVTHLLRCCRDCHCISTHVHQSDCTAPLSSHMVPLNRTIMRMLQATKTVNIAKCHVASCSCFARMLADRMALEGTGPLSPHCQTKALTVRHALTVGQKPWNEVTLRFGGGSGNDDASGRRSRVGSGARAPINLHHDAFGSVKRCQVLLIDDRFG